MKALPIGSVMPWTGSLTKIPKGWLLCNGAELEAKDYPLLARVLRDTYGGDFDNAELFPNYTKKFRIPLVNQKCLADIQISHFSDNSANRPAPIDDSAASAIIGQYLGDEGDLGPPSTFFATTDLEFTYTPDPQGYISSYTFSGVAPFTTTAAVYKNVQSTTSGSGTGATFTVVKNTDLTYSVAIKNRGKDYAKNDTLLISFSNIGGTSSANNVTVTVNATGSSYFAGTVTGQTFIGGFDLKTVYVVPRKLGRQHMPQHFHPNQYESININDSGELPGTGVGVWDNPQIRVIQTYRQKNGCPNDFCFSLNCDPDGSLSSTGWGSYWADQTGENSSTATIGSTNAPFDTGFGKYALAAIGGSRPARTHTPITTSAAAHGVGKTWFTSAKKLRTKLSGETETTALTKLRTTGKIDYNTILPFSDDTSLIKQPNYDDGGVGSGDFQPVNEVLFNSAAIDFTLTSKADVTVNDVIESHDHEGEFNVLYDPGNLNIRDFITVNAQPNITVDPIPSALQIAFTLASPSLAITNLIRAY
jgi:microcystin-dependent protein